MNELKRKVSITKLDVEIAFLSLAMDLEQGATRRWRRLAQEHTDLIRKRNCLRTTTEIQQIEQERGLRR